MKTTPLKAIGAKYTDCSFIKASDFIDPTNLAIQGLFKGLGRATPVLKEFWASQTSIKPWAKKLKHWKTYNGASWGIQRIATVDLQMKLMAAEGKTQAFDELIALIAAKRENRLTPAMLQSASPEANILYKRTVDWMEDEVAKSLGLSRLPEEEVVRFIQQAEASGNVSLKREALRVLADVNKHREIANTEMMMLSSLYGDVPTRNAAWKWMDKVTNQLKGGSWGMFKGNWNAQVLEASKQMDEVLQNPAMIRSLKDAIGDEWFDDLVDTYKYQAQNQINALQKAKTPNVGEINKWKNKLSIIENYDKNIKGREAELISKASYGRVRAAEKDGRRGESATTHCLRG